MQLALNIDPHTSVLNLGTDDTTPCHWIVWPKQQIPNKGAAWSTQEWNGNTKLWETKSVQHTKIEQLQFLTWTKTAAEQTLAQDAVFVRYNDAEASDPVANFKVYKRNPNRSNIYRPKHNCNTII